MNNKLLGNISGILWKSMLAKVVNFIAIVSLVAVSFSPALTALAEDINTDANTNDVSDAIISETTSEIVPAAISPEEKSTEVAPVAETEAVPVVESVSTTPEADIVTPEATTTPEEVAVIEELIPVITTATTNPESIILTPEIITTAESTPAVATVTLNKVNEIWSLNNNKATTNTPVELGKIYVAPQNKDVTVTFTKLPETPGMLSIEEITLTPEQVTALGAVSNKAYDVTSDMVDGTFAYDLTLPKPNDGKNVEVKFAENEANLENADTIAASDTEIKSDIVNVGLDHFTIFVVTTPSVIAPACTGVSVSHSAADKCFNTIQAAIDDGDTMPGDVIKVKAGNYGENVTVNKGLTLQGESGVNLTGQITVTSDNATINKFAITNPGGTYGILVKANGILIENSTFDGIGTTVSGNGAVQAVYIYGSSSNVTVKNNTFTNIGTDVNTASNKAIYIGDSNNGPSSNINIEGNDISKVVANPTLWVRNVSNTAWLSKDGKGAYGILINHQVSDLTIKNNTIKNIDGLWAHAIGLEWDTPGAIVTGNRINNLKDYKDPSDAVALRLESNPSAPTVISTNNKYEGKNLLLDTTNVYVDSAWDTLSTNGNTYPEVLNGSQYLYYGINAFSTIKDAVAGVAAGGTIHVAAGTFTEVGQIVIDKDMSIVGKNKTQTIIKPAQDTGSATHSDLSAWLLVNSGITFNLSNVTFDGSGKNILIGILSHGHGLIKNNIFTNIRYTKYLGFGIELYGSDMTISNNKFTNIEREGVFNGNGTNSTISKNTYIGKGDGDWLDYAFEVGRGSNALISENTISKNSGVASDSSTSAGILVTSYYGPGSSSATITGNTISKCTDAIAVGYTDSDTSAVTAHDNNLAGNLNGVSSTKPLVDATNNWWGAASGPEDAVSGDNSILDTNLGGTGSVALGAVMYAPWYADKAMTTLTSPNAITNDANNLDLYSATINGTNGDYPADNTSFWWGTTMPANPITSSSQFGTLSGWNHDSGLGIKAANASFSENLASLTPGTTYYFIAWSQVGTTWHPGEIKNFTTDSLLAPTLNSPADNSFVRGIPSLINSWSAVPGAVKYDYESYHDQAMHSLRYSDTYTTTSKTATNVADSAFWWRVRAVDAAGNKGPWSSLWKVTVDNTAPNSPSNLGMKVTSSNVNIPNNSITNQSGVTAYWSANNTEPVSYIYKSWYDNSSPYNQSNPWTHQTSDTSYSGVFNQGDGPAYFCVVAVDLAGNQSPCSETFTVNYDATAPVVDISSPAAGLVSGTINIKGGVTDINPHHYYLVIKNSANAVVAGPGTVNDASSFTDKQLFTWDTTLVPDGTYVIDLEARDAANNKGTVSVKTVSVTVDNTAPDAPQLTSPDDGATVSGNPKQTWTAVSGADHYIYASYSNQDGTSQIYTASLNGTSRTVGGLQTVTFYWRVKAIDAVGNESPWSDMWKLIVDNTVPTLDTTAPVITLSGSDTVNLTVGDAYTDAGATALDDIDGDISGSIVTVNPVDTNTADTYIITYNVSDVAGNAAAQVSRTVIVSPASSIDNFETSRVFGGGGGAIVYCESAEYVCINNVKNIVSQTPATCSFTSTQLSKIGEPCEDNGGDKQVLGVQKYAVGTLLRSNLNHRIYLVTGETTIQRILNLKELAKYKGHLTLNVDESVIASFQQVLGVKAYADGTLVRHRGSNKIYVVINGEFIHIKTLKELAKYFGQPILEID